MVAAPKNFDSAGYPAGRRDDGPVASAVSASRCGPIVLDALSDASRKLSDSDRTILTLHYKTRAQSPQTAGHFSANPPTTTRQIERIQKQIVDEATGALAERLGLSGEFLRQHLAEVIDYLDASNLILSLLA